MMINNEDVAGYNNAEGHFICSECMTKEDWDLLQRDNILTVNELDNTVDFVLFCDECGTKQT